VEFFFGEERRASKSLMDKDVSAALGLVLETLRTEDKGIFYDRVSSDLRVDSLRRQLQEIVKFHRSPPETRPGDELLVSEAGKQSMKLVDIIESLEVIRDTVASHMEGDSASQSYVNSLARLLPRSSKVSASGGNLIVPGS
jgi:hypothetical protein